MKKPLENANLYLSGPIQYDVDYDWREEPRKILRHEFGISVFDPFSDPKQQWVPSLQKAQEIEDYETITKIAKSFVRKDLSMVDRADFVIAFLPHKVPTAGTTHEIINSNNAKKPTLLVTDYKNKTGIPLWYYGFINSEFMFAGWESLYEYLREVNERKHEHNNRWDFLYGKI